MGMGTCLYRRKRTSRLPLKLVTTKAHLFIRWEGDLTPITGHFKVGVLPWRTLQPGSYGQRNEPLYDEHYKQWPFPVTEEEMRADGYLKSLTPDEELALFRSIRGHCMMAAHRYADAQTNYAKAAELAPNLRGYRLLHENASRLVQLAGKETP